ncbi:putative retrotransposon gag domain, retrotransposon Copia-like protein [Helianthus annuus]|nr:putative retrotransposon gag domain, retrotransposon Copia-like protein [Helianthus annuus]
MAGNDSTNKEKTGTGGSIDYGSPYYLHPSDYPKQLHVNEELTDNNYGDWVQEMTNFLLAKNKIQFVDGTLKKPEKDSSEYAPWMRCDAMIKGWLTTAMEKNIRASVKYAGTSLEIWSDLLERFGKDSAPRAYELRPQIAETRQDGTSVSVYYTKLRSLWDESQSIKPIPVCSCTGCSCGLSKKMEYQEKERLYEFLMGLDTDFAVIRTQILATKPIPTLGTAYHMVAEDERQRTISTWKKHFKAFFKGNKGPMQAKEKGTVIDKRENKEGDHCTHCGTDGHKKEGCFKLVGYLDWWPGKTKGEKSRPKAACAETGSSPIPGLTDEQYRMFVEHFGGTNIKETAPKANMAGVTNEGLDWCG